jgi:uncharacterized membrane protein
MSEKSPLSKANWSSFGDIYLAFVSALLIMLHALLTSTDYTQSALGHPISLLVGVLLMVFPGYVLCRALGFERYSIATMAGLSLAFSFAVLALVGTIIWVSSRSFSTALLEVIAFAWIASLSFATLVHSPLHNCNEHGLRMRLQVLAVTTVPIGFAVLALSIPLPTSQATSYTEFFVNPDGINSTSSVASVSIVNRETRGETYFILAKSREKDIHSPAVTLFPGEKWTGTINLPLSSDGLVELMLYRIHDVAPYRTLYISSSELNAR